MEHPLCVRLQMPGAGDTGLSSPSLSVVVATM